LGIGRRSFLAFFLGGMVGFLLVPRKSGGGLPVVRPPGAVDENVFTGLCSRCGNCINICPENIIVPDIHITRMRGLLTPIVLFRNSYCNEWCSKCLDSCPTGAIRRLGLEQKRMVAMGHARINKNLCLGWTKKQNCLVCKEFCPYQAITTVQNGDVNCPEVIEKICRGCGACENHCPAIPEKAIIVSGIPEQKIITADVSQIAIRCKLP
jgi:ferredoxin-type protein NapF